MRTDSIKDLLEGETHSLEIPVVLLNAVLLTKTFKALDISNRVSPITKQSRLTQATVYCVQYTCVHTS